MRLNVTLRLAALIVMGVIPGVTLAHSDDILPVPENIRSEAVPPISARYLDDLNRYADHNAARFMGWGPAGRSMLVVKRSGEVDQLHQLFTPLGEALPLTQFNEPVRRGALLNDGQLFFMRDNAGDERFQFFLRREQSDEIQRLSEPDSRNAAVQMSSDRRRIAYSAARREGSDLWGVVVTNLTPPYDSQVVFQEGGAWSVLDWASDNRRIAVANFYSINEVHLYIADVETGIKIPIDSRATPTGYGDARFSADGKLLFFTSNAEDEFLRLRALDLASGAVTVLSGDIPWDVGQIAVSPDGRWLAFTYNENGIFRLVMRDLIEGENFLATELPVGVITDLAFDPSSKRVGFTLDGAVSGSDVYSMELDDPSGQNWILTQWTDGVAEDMSDASYVEPTMISYASLDNVGLGSGKIPAIYYKPKKTGKSPVIIHVHGGPEAQYVPRYDPQAQFWAGHLGIAVIAPNIRGSTGYGRQYTMLDNGERREDAIKDIGALLDWIARQEELDASRVMIHGASYGGYVALASMTHYDKRLLGGISIVGISNLASFLDNTGGYRRDLRRQEYGDERNPKTREFLERISPLNNSAKMTKPLFVAQGLNDPRVPASESEGLVAALRGQGNEVWYVLALDEGHNFAKRSNSDYVNAAMTQFIESILLDPSPPRPGESLSTP